MAEHYPVSVGAGTLRLDDGVAMNHPWTGAGVTFDALFSGAHLLHLAVAACVLNDVYREAQELGHQLSGVRVTAEGAFEADESGMSWSSSGIEYTVAVDSALDDSEVTRLLELVEERAEVPQVLRAGIPVTRVGHA